jgi:two-component system, chemotaxis family, response regulator PixG
LAANRYSLAQQSLKCIDVNFMREAEFQRESLNGKPTLKKCTDVTSMTLTNLTKELDHLNKYGDGELILRNHSVIWKLYLARGQLVYAMGEVHPVRRWNRALKQHCPKWDWSAEFFQLSGNQPWECKLLDLGLNQKRLSLIQANSVIRTVFEECLFDLISDPDLKSFWSSHQEITSTYCRVVSLSKQGIQSVFTKAMKIQRKWQSTGLDHLNPTLAPVLQQEVSPQVLPIMDEYLNGKFTLWDIATQLEQSVIEVTTSLIPLVEKGILQFQEIPDLPIPTVKQPVIEKRSSIDKPLKSQKRQSLIACIDDSPVLTLTLKKILTPAGYDVLSIPEPMRGFGELIEHKPELILLDLLLPNADGYSICKFLRETPVFKYTPIIILTAQNTSIDRARAQLVGATEFLGKPPKPQELLQIVQRYLHK